MIMDEGEGKKLKNYCVVENIEPQKKLRECDEIRGNEKKCSPMSKTRLKQGSEEWGNRSNVSNTIVKQNIPNFHQCSLCSTRKCSTWTNDNELSRS